MPIEGEVLTKCFRGWVWMGVGCSSFPSRIFVRVTGISLEVCFSFINLFLLIQC